MQNNYCPCRQFCDREKLVNYYPKNYWSVTFDNFDIIPANYEAFEKSRVFFKSNKSIYLFGEPGTGKTHLLFSAFKDIKKQYCALEFASYSVSRLLKIDRYEFESYDEAVDRLLTYISRKEIIFLDDFCSENVTGKTAEFLYCLVDEAIANGKPRLFITGNKPLKFISENISDRIASRIAGLCGKENIIKVGGNDNRLK